VKVEFKRRVKPLKADELINQNHPLFIGKFFGSEARYEHDEVDNRVRYIEKHLEPPLIPSNYQYAGVAIRLILQWYAGRRRERRLNNLAATYSKSKIGYGMFLIFELSISSRSVGMIANEPG
jgi:hypothetical protein